MPLANNQISAKLTGVNELRYVLKNLPEEVRFVVLNQMCDEGTKPLESAIKNFVKVRTGGLKKSISRVVRKYPRNYIAVGVVGPDRGYYRSGKRVKKNDDVRGADRPSKIAHLVEFGFTTKDGTRVPAQPFMRPGTIVAQSQIVEAMAKGAMDGIEKARRKLVKSS